MANISSALLILLEKKKQVRQPFVSKIDLSAFLWLSATLISDFFPIGDIFQRFCYLLETFFSINNFFLSATSIFLLETPLGDIFIYQRDLLATFFYWRQLLATFFLKFDLFSATLSVSLDPINAFFFKIQEMVLKSCEMKRMSCKWINVVCFYCYMEELSSIVSFFPFPYYYNFFSFVVVVQKI